MSGSFYYFAYGEYMDPATLKAAIQAHTPSDAAAASASEVHCVGVGYISNMYLCTTAVSVESPRLGLLNVIPPPPPQPEDVCAPSAPSCDPIPSLMRAPPEMRVYGVLYELPEAARHSLLEAAGSSGSYNLWGRLACTVVSEPAARVVQAVVVAGFDVVMMERRYGMAGLDATWQPLPPPRPLPLSTAPSSGSPLAETVWGTGRWPGTHQCNWPCSPRLLPSGAHLQAVRQAWAAQVLARVAVPVEYTDGYAAIYTAPLEGSESTAADEETTWYFAYGSNLSWEQVCVRIGPPLQRRPVRLDDYVLVANKTPVSQDYASFGYYNVEAVDARRARLQALHQPDSAAMMPPYVCGAAYEIAQAQLALMDTFESGYRRECHTCTDLLDGTTRKCWVYIALHTSETLLPSKEYLARVLEGRDILPGEYMDAIQRSPTNPLRSPRQDKRLRKEL